MDRSQVCALLAITISQTRPRSEMDELNHQGQTHENYFAQSTSGRRRTSPIQYLQRHQNRGFAPATEAIYAFARLSAPCSSTAWLW